MKDGDETSQGRSEQGIPLMTAQAIKQMKDEQIIGFHRRLPPFRMKRIDWRQHPGFIQKRQLPAPQLSPLPAIAEIPLQTQQVFADGYIDPDTILLEKRK